MKDEVAAIVVTYNRKLLLVECLRALRAQTLPVARIYVIDNASTDGTEALLEHESLLRDERIEYLRLERNIGGAGGFHYGIERAVKEGWQWLWLMDDDTIADSRALAEMDAAYTKLAHGGQVPLLLSSRVDWVDDEPHPMNYPKLYTRCWPQLYAALAVGAIPLRSCSFVSLLLHREAVERYGLPYAKYFIWNDDVEYSARILRHEFGVLVGGSRVIHKTATRYSAVSAPGERFYYEVRNKLWMIFKSDAFTVLERVRHVAILAVIVWKFLRKTRFVPNSLRVVVKGIWHGLVLSPR